MATSKPSVGAGSSAGNVKNPAEILESLVKISSDETMTEFIRLCLSKLRTGHSPQAPTTPKAVILEGLIKLSAKEDNGETIRLILSNMGTEDSPQAPTSTTGRALKNKKTKEHKTWECHVCHRYFNNPSNCKRHVQQQHPDKQLPKQTPEKKQSKSKVFKTYYYLKRWPCKLCKKTYCFKSYLEKHFRSCHRDANIDDGHRISNAECQSEDGEDGRNSSNAEYQPEDDGEESVSSGHEGQVRESEENISPIMYRCEKCDAAAIDMDTAVEHSQIHHLPDYVPVLVTCDVCNFKFETQYFDDHSLIHDHIDDGFLMLFYNPYGFLDNDWPDRIRNMLETSAIDIKSSQEQGFI